MKQQRCCMELVREVFRLKWSLGKSNRCIGKALSISKSTVGTYLARAANANISSLEELATFTDDELKRIIFPDKFTETVPVLDFNRIHKELGRKHVTLMLLWEEESAKKPDLYNYSRFCQLYKDWRKEQSISMRQVHKAGEKAFIDYAGTTVDIIDPKTSEIKTAQIFVMCLGGSDLAYVEATFTQGSKDFIRSNINGFKYFGGVPEILVPDNLKSGVNTACKYEPEINRNYREMAKHYGAVVIPTRVRKPKDKAKVEGAVLIASRWILARLRDHSFFCLEDLNLEISKLLEDYNNKKFQKRDGSRRSVFNEIEKEALKTLPSKHYEVAEWKKVKPNIDYHITLEHCHYSVPYKLRHKKLEARYTDRVVEIYFEGKRVASHFRLYKKGSCSTTKDHMPAGHQEYQEWNPSRLINWGRSIGSNTGLLLKKIMESREHPELGYKSCLGIMRLGKKYPKDRLESACGRCLKIGSYTYKSVESILKKGIESSNDLEIKEVKNIEHENIRGGDYYQ